MYNYYKKILEAAMKLFSCSDYPIEVHGLVNFQKSGSFERLPEEIMQKLPNLRQFGSRSTGGRITFKTDTKKLYLKLVSKTFIRDVGTTQIGSSGIDVYIGDRKKGIFIGSVYPTGAKNTDPLNSESTFSLPGEITDVTVFMPKNEIIENIFIGIDDDASLFSPTPYVNELPVVFYGSSITEGGSAGRCGNAYTAFLSRHLNMDYINFGFSGSAKGETEMAEYIASLPMSVFVLDYDHNAPDEKFLENTHERFFKTVREKNPYLPIIIMTMPDYMYDEAACEKRTAVIRKTYENAIENGDKNVYFIDGKTFFGDDDVFACTVDKIHPNDLGCYRMAKVIEKTLSPLIEKIGR